MTRCFFVPPAVSQAMQPHLETSAEPCVTGVLLEGTAVPSFSTIPVPIVSLALTPEVDVQAIAEDALDDPTACEIIADVTMAGDPEHPATFPAHHCYILHNTLRPSTTYNGYTVHPARRLRQHNGELAGGAKATSRLLKRGGRWTFLAIVSAEGLTKHTGLSLEWHCRYPTCRRPRPAHLQGPSGRLRGLAMALAHPKFAHLRRILIQVDTAWTTHMRDALQQVRCSAVVAGI